MAENIDPIEEPEVDDSAGKPPVPYVRFAETSRERTRYKRELDRLAPIADKVGTLEKTLAERESALAAAEAKHAAERASWLEERDILGAGVFEDPAEALDVARMVHARLPEQDRPSLVAWAKSLTAEGATVPRALQSYVRRQPAAAVDAKPADPKAPVPKVENPGKPPPTAPVYTPERMREIRLRAQKTGDLTELRKMTEDIKTARRS